MSGHSKWSTIKHKKGKADAKRGAIFGKLARAITISVKESGADPVLNPTLQTLIEKARGYNMPSDNIDRAVKKGTGEGGEGASYETVYYEGYGPGGTAIYVEVATDNRNRAAADVRYAFSKNGGNLGESGCVGWMFERKGELILPSAGHTEEEVLDVAIDAGAESMADEGENFTLYTDPTNFFAVKNALSEAGFKIESAEVVFAPKNTVEVPDASTAKKLLRLVEALEDLEDVQEVYSNFDIPEEIFNEITQ